MEMYISFDYFAQQFCHIQSYWTDIFELPIHVMFTVFHKTHVIPMFICVRSLYLQKLYQFVCLLYSF